MKIPEKIFGMEIKGSMDLVLSKSEASQPKASVTPAIELSGYIHIPSINKHIAKQRTLNGKTWYDAHKELQSQGLRMPTVNEFIEFLKYLKHGYPNRQEAEYVLDDILTVKSPWRAEWLDAKFEKKNNIWCINYSHEVQGSELIAQYSKELEACLMQDKTPGIDLDDWLNNANSQGLPKPDVKQGPICYWYPRENAVARFLASSDRAGFLCYGYPEISNSDLGVRAVREAPR